MNKLTLMMLAGCACAFAQAPASAPLTVGGAINTELSLVERTVVAAAEAMPADKYNFSPDSLDIKGANFKGVYTFAGLVKHIAATNYMLWAGAAGEKPPANVMDTKGPATLTAKADIVQFLKDSFALGHRAANTLTAENSTEMIAGLGGRPTARVFVVTFLLVHAYDEYGQMEEYLRMNGIVPPASAPPAGR